MAITKSIIVNNITIQDANGANGVTYELPLTESVEVTVTPVTDQVAAGRTLASAFDISGTVKILNTNVYSDARVYGRNTAAEAVLGRIVFNGATGAQSMNCGPTIINGQRKYEDGRATIELTFTEKVTNVEAFIIES
jgi:hypothetical protein